MTFDDEYNPRKIGEGKFPSDAKFMARVKEKNPEFHKGVLKANEGNPIEQQLNPDPGLPGELEEVAAAASRCAESNISMARLQLLSVLSCCLQPHFDVEPYWGGGKGIPLSLFTFAVAGSSEGKTTTFNYLTASVKEWNIAQRKRHSQAMKNHRAMLKDANRSDQTVDVEEPVNDRRVFSNPTIEALRQSLAGGYEVGFWRNDEAGMLVGGYVLNKDNQYKPALFMKVANFGTRSGLGGVLRQDALEILSIE